MSNSEEKHYTMIPLEIVLERIRTRQAERKERWSETYSRGVADTMNVILEVAEEYGDDERTTTR